MRLFDEAGEAYEQVLQGRKASLEPGHADTMTTDSDMADLHTLQSVSQAQEPAKPQEVPTRPRKKPLHNLQTLNQMLKEKAMNERETDLFTWEEGRETDRSSMLEGKARSSKPTTQKLALSARLVKSPDHENSNLSRWDLKLMHSILKDRKAINQYDVGGFTPLAWALKTNQIDLARQFVDMGADVNAKLRDNGAALLIAARQSSPDALQYLLDHGADAHVVDCRGNTAIHIAVANPDDKVLDILLSYHTCSQAHGLPDPIPIDAFNNDGQTALHLAVTLPDPVKKSTLLLRHGASPSLPSANNDQPAWHMAIKGDHVALVEALLDFPEGSNQPGGSNSAINNFSLDGITPLQLAILEASEDMVRLLLSRGAEVNLPFLSDGSTPLLYCLNNHRLRIAEILLTTPPTTGSPSSSTSATAEIDVTTPDDLGWTPLHVAALKGYDALLRLMLDRPGADIELRNGTQSTPLHCAAAHGWDACVRLLLERGADGSAVDGAPVEEAVAGAGNGDNDDDSRLETRDPEKGGGGGGEVTNKTKNTKTKVKKLFPRDEPRIPRIVPIRTATASNARAEQTKTTKKAPFSRVKTGNTPLGLARRAAMGFACIEVLAEFGYTDPVPPPIPVAVPGVGSAATSFPSSVLRNRKADTDGASTIDTISVAGHVVAEKEKEFL